MNAAHDSATVARVRIDAITVVDRWHRPVNQSHVAGLQESLSTLPPITVSADLRLVDGRHRLLAHQQAGESLIHAVLLPEGLDDAALLAAAVRSNVTHGLQLTRAERRQAATLLIEAGWVGSDRALASLCRVSRATAATVRGEVRGSTERPTGKQGQLDGDRDPVTSVLAGQAAERRIGDDGRSRPEDAQGQRRRIRLALEFRPDASCAEVARQVGASKTTVSDERQKMAEQSRPSRDVRCRWWRRIWSWLTRGRFR